MKKAWLLTFCLFYFWSCQPDDAPLPVKEPVKEPETPVYTTEKGTPEGAPVSVTIGAGGGSISTPDNRITLNIPAGALSSNTTITIQPITNKTPNGIGLAYRLLPNGQQLSKPAILNAHYKETDLEGTAADAFGIAYQDDRGAWLAKSKVTVNSTTKTVSKEISLLKDHSFFSDYVLLPRQATILPGEEVDLQVKKVLYKLPISEEDGDVLITGEAVAEPSQINSWKINGQNTPIAAKNGSLSGTGASRKYKAPDAAPAVNPIAVSVEMDGPEGTKLMLVSNITITRKMWQMHIEWLRVNRCVPGAIASSTYTCSADIEFGLDKESKITVAKIINNNDIVVKDVKSCNEEVYSASAQAEGLNIVNMTGQFDAKTGQLKFDLDGMWMDFPTYTLQYKEGPTVVTDRSMENFAGINMMTMIPLKDGQILDLRSNNASTDAGFVFKLTALK